METKEILKRVRCDHENCQKPFHLRLDLQNADADGKVEVGIDCPYCAKKVIVTVDRKYAEEVEILRSQKEA